MSASNREHAVLMTNEKMYGHNGRNDMRHSQAEPHINMPIYMARQNYGTPLVFTVYLLNKI